VFGMLRVCRISLVSSQNLVKFGESEVYLFFSLGASFLVT
jgi:hypothetical protein